jgi:pyruvate formate lyase activating enzyme
LSLDKSAGESRELKGLVFDIQRYSIHDGPGIRTLVFLKGCPLHCLWCCNPEGIENFPELVYFNKRCIGCGKCLKTCPNNAVYFLDTKGFITDRDKCQRCGQCAEVCPPRARVISGNAYSVDDVLKVVERDRPFYMRSGGGMTVSGGEIMLQHRFVSTLLEEAHLRLINTAIETSGFGSWENLLNILNHTDYIFMDIKHFDSDRHKELTGVPNEIILANALRVSDHALSSEPRKPFIIRVPIIPGFNDSESNIKATVGYVKEELKGVSKIELLAYHRLGTSKWERIGKVSPTEALEPPSKAKMEALKEIVVQADLECKVR